jgi:hypothetical protein
MNCSMCRSKRDLLGLEGLVGSALHLGGRPVIEISKLFLPSFLSYKELSSLRNQDQR